MVAFGLIIFVWASNYSDSSDTTNNLQTTLSDTSEAVASLLGDLPRGYGFFESQKNEFNLFVAEVDRYFNGEENAVTEHPGFKKAEVVSKWPLMAFLLTAMFCFGCSTVCHLMHSKNPKVSRIVSSLDYWGIVNLILGTNYPFISFRYSCGYLIVYRYIFISCLMVLTICCMVVTVKTTFLRPTPKAILFISFGLLCMIPTILLYFIYTPEMGLPPKTQPYSWPILFYLLGLLFFMSKVPERYSKTGQFDYFFSSHQIHHLCVIGGVLISF